MCCIVDVPHQPGPQLRRAGQQLRAGAPGTHISTISTLSTFSALFTISITIISTLSTLSTRRAAGRGEDLRRAVHLHRLQHRGRHHEQLQNPHRQM